MSDGFRLLSGVGAIRSGRKAAFIGGEYETAAGSSVAVTYEGTPQDALPLKDFLEPQLRVAAERDVKVRFVLTFEGGLAVTGDAPAKLIEQLTDRKSTRLNYSH